MQLVLDDKKATQITDAMVPYFKSGRNAAGLRAGVQDIRTYLEKQIQSSDAHADAVVVNNAWLVGKSRCYR